MKKWFLVVLIALVGVMSCSKYNPLADTVWETEDASLSIVLTFTESEFVLQNDSSGEVYSGDYVYSHRNVDFNILHFSRGEKEEYDGGGTFNAELSGWTLYVDLFGQKLIMKKQKK